MSDQSIRLATIAEVRGRIDALEDDLRSHFGRMRCPIEMLDYIMPRVRGEFDALEKEAPA